MNNAQKEDLLSTSGWNVECWTPMVIRHFESGDIATGRAADMVVTVLEQTQPAALFVELVSLKARTDHLVATTSVDGWNQTFDLVFSDSILGRVSKIAERLNSPLTYYDPDGDYDEDVQAFSRALDDKVEALRPLFAGLSTG